jgi:ABC-type Co2+ transport system permease subunit
MVIGMMLLADRHDVISHLIFTLSSPRFNRYNRQIDKPLNIKIKMLFFLGSVLFLVVGLPLLFFMLGEGEAYVTWGPWISAIALMLWLLMDVEKIRRGR